MTPDDFQRLKNKVRGLISKAENAVCEDPYKMASWHRGRAIALIRVATDCLTDAQHSLKELGVIREDGNDE